jgi:hypothetical protein
VGKGQRTAAAPPAGAGDDQVRAVPVPPDDHDMRNVIRRLIRDACPPADASALLGFVDNDAAYLAGHITSNASASQPATAPSASQPGR